MYHKHFIKYEHTLQRNQLHTLQSKDCLYITCQKGNAWVTENNSADGKQ